MACAGAADRAKDIRQITKMTSNRDSKRI